VSSTPLLQNVEQIPFGDYFGVKGKSILPKEVCVNEDVSYDTFIANHEFCWKRVALKPLYIKKPNIT